MTLIRYSILVSLALWCHSSIFCDQASDNKFKQLYPALPKNAANIVVNKTVSGDFIDYDDHTHQKVFIGKNGRVIDFKANVESLIATKPEYLNQYKLNNCLIDIKSINDHAQVVGTIVYVSIDNKGALYLPFLWSPFECKLLPTLGNEYNCYIASLFINNHGIIVGSLYKSYTRPFYLGKAKKQKQLVCRELVPVVWLNPTTIKEISLLEDVNDKYSYLGTGHGRPYFLTIDNSNTIHFWSDYFHKQYSGSIHLSELD